MIALAAFLLSFLLTQLLFRFLPSESVTDREYEERVRSLLGQIISVYPKIRNLTVPSNINLKIVSREWVIENWGKPSVQQRQKVIIDEVIFKSLLLIDENYNLSKFLLSWSGMILSATCGYDLYIVRDFFDPNSPNAKRTLAHEITHIVQFHYFHPPQRETFDGKQALSALIEGDADLTADLFVNLSQSSSSLDGSVPKELLMLWSFPYDYGRGFVAFLYSIGGWKLVNQAYSSPPETTEQVIHPEKYLRNELFKIPDVKINETNWNILRTDRMGEYFIYVLIFKWCGEEVAESASSGWNGDILVVGSNSSHYLVYWRICWDSANDAKEFFDAFCASCSKAGGLLVKSSDNFQSWIIGRKVIVVSIDQDTTTIKSYFKQ